jgi:tRNA threonylcarbamoyladenosine biosynthesis protein TsaB
MSRASAWLAIDTATDWLGIALWTSDGVLAETVWRTRRAHTRRLAPGVAAVLAGHGLAVAELTGIAVAAGPGSYTGLRVGIAFAKGLALASGVAVQAVPTLDVLAAPLRTAALGRDAPLWVAVRAGRGRLVAAAYDPSGGLVRPLEAPQPITVAELVERAAPGDWVAGELDAQQRNVLAEAGLVVLPVAAGIRRPGWLAELAAAGAGQRYERAELGALVPVYPGGEAP